MSVSETLWPVAYTLSHSNACTSSPVLVLFPQPRATAITAPRVGQDQQLIGLREGHPSGAFPPVGDCVHRELGCIRRVPDIHRPTIVGQVVDPVRHGAARRIVEEIMHIDGLSFLA